MDLVRYFMNNAHQCFALPFFIKVSFMLSSFKPSLQTGEINGHKCEIIEFSCEKLDMPLKLMLSPILKST